MQVSCLLLEMLQIQEDLLRSKKPNVSSPLLKSLSGTFIVMSTDLSHVTRGFVQARFVPPWLLQPYRTGNCRPPGRLNLAKIDARVLQSLTTTQDSIIVRRGRS